MNKQKIGKVLESIGVWFIGTLIAIAVLVLLFVWLSLLFKLGIIFGILGCLVLIVPSLIVIGRNLQGGKQ